MRSSRAVWHPASVSTITASSTILRIRSLHPFFDGKKLPSMCVKFAATHRFSVHELGMFPEVSKSSLRTYIRLLPDGRVKILANGEQ
jgi:hypothetical protein